MESIDDSICVIVEFLLYGYMRVRWELGPLSSEAI